MSIQELTLGQIESLVGTHNIVTGIEYPENGKQPYYEWLVQTLDLLSNAATSSAALKVNRDDSGPTIVVIAPGSAVLGGAVMAYAGGTIDLAFYNNDVAHLWLYDDSGSPAVGIAGSVDGWPGTPHLKLAEVALSAGVIISILDHRTDLALTDFNPASTSGTNATSFLVNDESTLARLQLDTNGANGDFILALSPSDLTDNQRWTFPDVTDIVVGLTAAQTLTNKTLTSATINDGVITGAAITGLSLPSDPSDAATKGYVDSVAQGLDIKQSLRVATTVDITLSGLQTVDSVSVLAGDRVLVKDQTSAAQNGIYVAASGAWSRAPDADSNDKVTAGLAIFVTGGDTQADTMWVLVTDDPITLGASGLVFTQFGDGISAVEDDPTPMLGGNLDLNGHSIVVGGNSLNSDGSMVLADGFTVFGNDGSAGFGGGTVGILASGAAWFANATVSIDAEGVVTATNLSGTNTGDQTITLTGDATGSGTGSFAVTLADSGVTAASYGGADAVPVLTIDAKGRVTGATTAALGSIATHDDGDYLPISGGTLAGGLTLGGDLTVGLNSFVAADATPLITFVDDVFGNHQFELNVNVFAQGRSFLDSEEIPYLTFDSGGAPSTPLIIQHDGEGVPVLSSNGSLAISAGSSLNFNAGVLGGEINHFAPCYFGKYLRLSATDGALIFAEDVPFRDNLDDQNTFLLFNSSDLSLYVGTDNGPVVLGGNGFSVFGVAPVGMQPCGVEVVSLTDDSGGTVDGGGTVAAIGPGATDTSAASRSDVQNAFATVISVINQLTIQVNKQRSLLLAFGWGFDET